MLDLRTGNEMTRRETIKGGLGLAAILAAGKAPAYLLGARGVAFGAWKNPYITDGLISMWDSEWNAGGGCHTTNLSQMRPVVGDSIEIVNDYYGNCNLSISEKSLNVNGGGAIKVPFADTTGYPLTFEVVICHRNWGPNIWSTKFGIFAQIGLGLYTQYNSSVIYIDTTILSGAGYFTQKDYGIVSGVNKAFSESYNVNNEIYRLMVNGGHVGVNKFTSNTYRRSLFMYLGCMYGGYGDICTARLYNRTLSNEEVVANYAIDKVRFNIP